MITWASEDARRCRVLHEHPEHQAMTLVEIARCKRPVLLHAVTFYGGFKSRYIVSIDDKDIAECTGFLGQLNAVTGPCAPLTFIRPIRFHPDQVMQVNEIMDPTEEWRQTAKPPPALFRVSLEG